MKWIYAAGLALTMVASGASADLRQACDIVKGSTIISQNDEHTFLGTIEDSYGQTSIFNEYSPYGSTYSMTSIWNQYSDSGSEYGMNSAFNPYSTEPPMIVRGGQVLGYLTVSETMGRSLSPDILRACKRFM
ncbi:hypothetical protein ACTUVN_002691 [Pseudomonas caspiana]